MRSGAVPDRDAAGPPPPARRRRRSARSRSCPARRRGSARPAPAAPPGAPRRPPAAASSRSSSSVMPPPAAAACRAPRRPRRLRAPCGRRGRRASRRPAAPGRSRAPTGRRAPGPARPAAATARGTAQRSRSSRPGTWLFTDSPVPASRCGGGRPGGRAPARRPTAVDSGGPSAVEPGGPGDRRQVDPQVDPVEQRPGQPGLVAPPLQRAARAGGVAGRAGARAGIGRQHELGPAREGGRARGPVDRHLTRAPAAAAGCRAPRAGTRAPRRGTARRGGPGTARPAGSAPSRRRSATAIVAEWCGASKVGRVTSGAPGGSVPATEWMAVTSSAACSSSGGSRPGQPLGQHRLARARRAGQEQVVPAGRGHLDRPPAGRLAHDVAEVGHRRCGRAAGRARAATAAPGRRRCADQLGRACRRRSTSTLSTSAASSAFAAGTTTCAVPGPGGGEHGRQHAADRRGPSRRGRARRAAPAGRPHAAAPPRTAASTAAASARSKPLPCLGIDAGDSPMVIRRCGNVAPGVDHRRADPVDRLAHHGVGQPDQDHLRHPGRHVDLDLDHRAVHAGQADRPGAGERHENAARRCVTSAGPARRAPARRRRRTAGPGACSSCAASQRWASVRSRRCLAAVTASTGWPKPTPRRVFTSQKTSASPSRATMSSSPSRQRQLRSSTRRPASVR